MSDERELENIIGRYVRAADNRDSAAMAALYADDATIEIFYRGPGGPELIGSLKGAETIGQAVAGMMAPHPPLGWSHHTLLNHIIEVNGDAGSVDSQFVVYDVLGRQRPEAGWPEGAFGAQGTITPIESGYGHYEMSRIGGAWKITHLTITHDLPYALAEN